MLKIGIIVGSTRPGRKAGAVAKWVHDILKSKDAEFEIVVTLLSVETMHDVMGASVAQQRSVCSCSPSSA